MESHSFPTSVALALFTQSVLSFINHFQKFEHCGCGLLNIQRIARGPQPSFGITSGKVLFSRMP